VPHLDIPENVYIVTATTPHGESIALAIGVCICRGTRNARGGKFWLRAGEQWVCPECGRVYTFDGERITDGEFADASRD
jgi:hypothetical protein